MRNKITKNNLTNFDFLQKKEDIEELIDSLIMYDYGKLNHISAKNKAIINRIKKQHNINILVKQLETLIEIKYE